MRTLKMGTGKKKKVRQKDNIGKLKNFFNQKQMNHTL